ncbi:hypothetical protein BS78_K012200 [Paspalum vaginatum]|uniref:DUF1618 domain-containing protein n=1 Tax=Paspalum vaginatum TaxID=158149 RepID=A0A9W7XDE7_9POAL|nr:hypothetical protein BS78_K012200 [Paspalum vaginatum]
METEADATTPPSEPSAATTYPRWVLLNRRAVAVGSSTTADGMTLVTARTSRGRHIGVSLRLAAPPAVSSVYINFPQGSMDTHGSIVAAHGDSVLIYLSFKESAAAASAEPPRPPTLSLLQPYYLTKQEMERSRSYGPGPVQRYLCDESTGLLRRGDDEIAVAELELLEPMTTTAPTPKEETELLLLRSNRWSATRPPIRTSHHGGMATPRTRRSSCPRREHAPSCPSARLSAESPVLQHVPLPPEAVMPIFGPEPCWNVCATAGGTVKFISVDSRCCCGGIGSTHCQHSRHAYTINTWTLRMDDMVWVMDAMVDATELWALWFYERDTRADCDKTGFLILVDTRRKYILSVYRQSNRLHLCTCILPSRVSYYLNSNYPSSGNGESSVSKGPMDMIPSLVVAVDEPVPNEAGDSARSSSSKFSEPAALQVSAFLEAFQEIQSYGLDRDDMLKAYSILSQDNSRWFICLLGLPKNLRKDWLLMEIKAMFWE